MECRKLKTKFRIMDIFNEKIDLSKITCHSGGAKGTDSFFETIGEEFGVSTRAYSYRTKYHESKNKVEISDQDYEEGVVQIAKANKTLGRFGINKYMSLLARNWAQVKYSKQVFAVGHIVKAGEKSAKGYKNSSKSDVVDGGTGYAVQMAIDQENGVFVFDQTKDKWFRWSYTSLRFVEAKEVPAITEQDFAGIGTREIQPNGVRAIRDVYEKTFNRQLGT
jgi:hypothetical protein